MDIDFNKERDDDLIPDGVYHLHFHLRPGGYGDGLLLKLSKSGCLAMVDAELIIVEGPSSGRKMWETFNVEIVGNGLDPAVRDRYQRACSMGRGKLRRIWESAHGIAHEDDSPEAEVKRKASIEKFDGLIFRAEVATRKQDGYRPQNYLDVIVTGPDDQPTTEVAIVKSTKSADPFDDEIPF